ncbi:MAG: acyl-CoA dehydrogenase, partial [Planctomycetota bacterium]|nr:acyl-CoA dehydrogenase [Planctomycetota bacterium]
MQGFLSDIPFLYTFFGIIAGLVVLGFLEAPFIVITLGAAVVLAGFAVPTWIWVTFGVVAAVFNLLPLRRAIVTGPLMSVMKKLGFIPAISDTERQALEAGTVWAEGELFSGKPDFKFL